MTLNLSNITSPLTVIALFATIVEASALASLPFLDEDSQNIYTWFLVGFPPFLTILFFITLNFNNKALFSPEAGDNQDEPSPRERLSATSADPMGSSATEHVVILIGDQRFCELSQRELTAPLQRLEDHFNLRSRIISWSQQAAGETLIGALTQRRNRQGW